MQLKKVLLIWIAISIIFGILSPVVYAQERTLLPEVQKDFDCIKELNLLDLNPDPGKYFNDPDSLPQYTTVKEWRNSILGCGIKTGRIHFWMVPYYIVYIIEFIVNLSALIAILFIVIGGFKYIIAGVSDKKEEAKNTIMHAILGLAIVAAAWIIINVVQLILTI
jgi:hypothetical protein